jgi:hypothetical protein
MAISHWQAMHDGALYPMASAIYLAEAAITTQNKSVQTNREYGFWLRVA